MTGPQPEDDDLLFPVQACNVISLSANVQASFPDGVKAAVYNCLCFTVGDWVVGLILLAALFGKPVCLFIAVHSKVRGYPL